MAAAAVTATDPKMQAAAAKGDTEITLEGTNDDSISTISKGSELMLQLSKQKVIYADSVIFNINREGVSRTHLYIADRSGVEVFKIKVSHSLGFLSRKSYCILARVDGIFLNRGSVCLTQQGQYLIESDPWHSVTVDFTNNTIYTINTTTMPIEEIGVLKLASSRCPNDSNGSTMENGGAQQNGSERTASKVFNPEGDCHGYNLLLHPSYRSKLGSLHLDVLLASLISVLDSESYSQKLSHAIKKLHGARSVVTKSSKLSLARR